MGGIFKSIVKLFYPPVEPQDYNPQSYRTGQSGISDSMKPRSLPRDLMHSSTTQITSLPRNLMDGSAAAPVINSSVPPPGQAFRGNPRIPRLSELPPQPELSNLPEMRISVKNPEIKTPVRKVITIDDVKKTVSPNPEPEVKKNTAEQSESLGKKSSDDKAEGTATIKRTISASVLDDSHAESASAGASENKIELCADGQPAKLLTESDFISEGAESAVSPDLPKVVMPWISDEEHEQELPAAELKDGPVEMGWSEKKQASESVSVPFELSIPSVADMSEPDEQPIVPLGTTFYKLKTELPDELENRDKDSFSPLSGLSLKTVDVEKLRGLSEENICDFEKLVQMGKEWISFDKLYETAKLPMLKNGISLDTVIAFLQKNEIAKTSEEKRASISDMLAAAGVTVGELLEDAVRKDRALDTYEVFLNERVNRRKMKLETEIQVLKRKMELRQRIIQQDEALLKVWLTDKLHLEESMQDACAFLGDAGKMTVGLVSEGAEGRAQNSK